MSKHRVIFADSREMPELADDSVHLVVTSPPYWCIKDYNHQQQIGHDQPYQEYLGDLRRVLSECHRVLHPGCRAAINIGDQYLRAADHGRYRVQPTCQRSEWVRGIRTIARQSETRCPARPSGLGEET